ncbi:MAG: MFS transporter [Sulfurifustaceae bacterium]
MNSDAAAGNGTVIRAILFCAGFLGYLVPLILPIMVRNIAADLGTDVTTVGTLIGLQSIVVGVASLFVGPISDRYGRKKMLTLFLILNGAALCLFSQSRSLESFYLTGVLSAVAFSPLVFCALAYIGDYFAMRERGGVVGLVSGALYGAIALGVPIAVALMQSTLGWRAVFIAFGLFSVGVGLVSLGGLVNRGVSQQAAKGAVLATLSRYVSFLREPRLVGFLMVFFMIRLGVGMYFTYGPTYLLLSRDFPPYGFSLIYPVGAVLAFIASVYAGKLQNRASSKLIIMLASLSIITSIVLVVSYPTTVQDVVLIMGILSTGYMVSESFRMATLNAEAVSRVDATARGSFLGTVNFLIYIGTALGAFIGGSLLNLTQAAADHGVQLQVAFTNMVYLTSLLWAVSALLSLFVIGQKARSASAAAA